jgi:hypothetical protein
MGGEKDGPGGGGKRDGDRDRSDRDVEKLARKRTKSKVINPLEELKKEQVPSPSTTSTPAGFYLTGMPFTRALLCLVCCRVRQAKEMNVVDGYNHWMKQVRTVHAYAPQSSGLTPTHRLAVDCLPLWLRLHLRLRLRLCLCLCLRLYRLAP